MSEALGRPDREDGRDPFDALVDVLTAASRYDLALGVIPCLFAAAVAAASLFGLTTWQAMAAASLLAFAVLVDACYLNPPVDRGAR